MHVVSSRSGISKMVVVFIVAIILAVVIGTVVAYATTRPNSPNQAPTPSPTIFLTPTPTPSPTPSPSPSPTPSSTATNSPPPISTTPAATNSPSPTLSPTQTAAPTPTIAPTIAPTPIITPTAAPTPTPTPNPNAHTVDYKAVTNSGTDLWNIAATNSYTVVLNNTMKVSSGNQQLIIWAENSSTLSTQQWIWYVQYTNSTSFNYWVNTGAGNGPQGHLGCVNGVVTVVVNATSITFVGTSSFSTNVTFRNLGQIQTTSDAGNFNGGKLNISIQ